MFNSLINDNGFSQALDLLPIGVCIVDIDNRVVCWNRRCEKMYNVDRDFLIGKSVYELNPSVKLPEIMEQVLMGETKEHYINKDLGIIMTVGPIKDESGKVIGCISVEQDESSYEKITGLLADAEKKIKALNDELDRLEKSRTDETLIIGEDTGFKKQLELCRIVAPADASVLIQGESGTGKEMFAREIHLKSGRKGSLISVNCSAIPANIFESEFFGYEKGAFTGAEKGGKTGIVEAADGGTLFLDEIGEIPMELQSKLLRVLETGKNIRVGSVKEKPIDIRVVCATNRNLASLVEKGLFREDLFYRISTILIDIPPLRERGEDVLLLAKHYLDYYCNRYDLSEVNITDDMALELRKQRWKGNVRELRNYIERQVILMKSYGKNYIQLDEKHVSGNSRNCNVDIEGSLSERLNSYEKILVEEAFIKCNKNITETAKALGIPRTSLYYKLNKYKLVEKTDV